LFYHHSNINLSFINLLNAIYRFFFQGARKPRVPATSRAIPNFDEASNTNKEIRRPEEN